MEMLIIMMEKREGKGGLGGKIKCLVLNIVSIMFIRYFNICSYRIC